MHKIAVLYTLGNSDIDINNEKLNKEKQNFRTKTKEILDLSKKNGFKFQSKDSKLGFKIKDGSNTYEVSFPIFSSLISYLDSIPVKRNEIDYYFFYTDQKDEDHNNQDTLYLFELVKDLLKSIGVKEEDIVGKRIDFNPADYSEVFKYFNKFIEDEGEKFKEDYKDIYLVLGPGTPQMNSGLLLSFTDFERARFLYIPKEEKPRRINFPNVIRSKGIKESVINLINKFDYIAAYNLYETLPDPEEKKHIKILEALLHRINFDFDEAYNAFNEYYKKYVHDDDNFLEKLKNVFEKLRDKDETELLKELYYKFAISIEAKYYLDAVGMLFRFDEEILKNATEKLLNVKINSNNDFKEFREAVEKEKDLVEKLDANGIRFRDSSPNRVVYKKIVDYFYKKDKPSWLEKVIQSSESLEEKLGGQDKSLVELRNKTPFAHGFEGASRKKITTIYGEPEVLRRKLRECLKALDINVEDINDSNFPFRKINEYLAKKIKEL